MELESPEYKVVMHGGADTEVLRAPEEPTEEGCIPNSDRALARATHPGRPAPSVTDPPNPNPLGTNERKCAVQS